MKPPICCICGKDFRDLDEGGLIYFKKRSSDIDWDKKMEEEPGMVGHPPYADWFCGEHYSKAKELEQLTIDEAVEMLKKIWNIIYKYHEITAVDRINHIFFASIKSKKSIINSYRTFSANV